MRPLLTVCIPRALDATKPTRTNKEQSWLETWKHLEPQLETGDEVVLIDDNTEIKIDDGGFIPFEFEEKWVKVLIAPKTKKHIFSFNTLRNMGIEEAKNDPILLLNPNCIPAPNLLENARSLFDPGVVYGAQINYILENGNLKLEPRPGWKRNVPKNPWVDESPDRPMYLWGGCLLFSKKRTSTVGWFSKIYDGSWGLGEQDFIEKCYHSGLRLKYEPLLKVSHTLHPTFRKGYKQNRALYRKKAKAYSQNLSAWTPYKPKVLVLVVTMMRSYYLDQCLKRIFQNMIPVKVRLVNQGDQSKEMLDTLQKWSPRWAVDYIFNEHLRSIAKIRSETFTWAKEQGYDFVVTVDDDMLLMPGALDKLIMTARWNPQFHAIAGYCIESTRIRMLGGKEMVRDDCCYHYNLPYTAGLTEVDYVSSGLRIARLKPLILQDTDYDFGLVDWDYAKRMKQAGLKLAVTGEVGGYHGMMRRYGKWQVRPDPQGYIKIRSNRNRIDKMTQLFERKWGLKIGKRARPLPLFPHRLLARAKLRLGTILFRIIHFSEQLNFSEQLKYSRDLNFTGRFRVKIKETTTRQRSRLETYIGILWALAKGANTPKLMLAAGVSKKELHELLESMLSQEHVKALDIQRGQDHWMSIQYELTQKGENIVKYFKGTKRLTYLKKEES